MFRYAALVALLVGPLLSRPGSAHCDTTKGPVVTAARAALEAGDSNLVLHWVRPDDEVAVKRAFQHTLRVRALGPEAKELADRYFFETLVRIHRAGEGAPYTGLSDEEPEPIIATTDLALARGSADELEQKLIGAVEAGLAERFSVARAAARFRPGDVAGGRAFVAAYVPLTHWVEGVFTLASEGGEDHAGATEHDLAPHPIAPEPGGQTGAGAAADTHGRDELRHLPWILAGLLAITAVIVGAFLVRRRHAPLREPRRETAMRFTIPTSIKEEHDELHAELATATNSGGRTAAAAKAVAALMHPHFVREEEYALPPLGVLADLVKGAGVEELRDVLAMTDKLKVELTNMLEEHQAIVAALKTLAVAAMEESKPEIADFARRLMHHAMMEEQVMYPAAILVGEHIRQRLGSSRE